MDFIKIDDPRLDESFSLLFSFRKGDFVQWKDEPSLKGEVTDAVFVGELPAHAGDDVYQRGRTLYQVRVNGDESIIAMETEIDKVQRPKYAGRTGG